MPTVTIERAVTVEETAQALQEQLGDRYQVTTRVQGDDEALRVKRSAAALANVRLDHDDNITTFHVHGGGLIISRLINELGIAKSVAQAIQQAFGPSASPEATPN